MQAFCATVPRRQQETVVLESVTTELPTDSKIEPMTAPITELMVEKISLNKTTMGIANTSPVDDTADDVLL